MTTVKKKARYIAFRDGYEEVLPHVVVTMNEYKNTKELSIGFGGKQVSVYKFDGEGHATILFHGAIEASDAAECFEWIASTIRKLGKDAEP